MDMYYDKKEDNIIQWNQLSDEFIFLIVYSVTYLEHIHVDMTLFRKDFKNDVFIADSWKYVDFNSKNGDLVSESELIKNKEQNVGN